VQLTKARWDHTPFVAPPGIRMMKISRSTGQRVFGGTPGDPKAEVIWEAFKPETEPQRVGRQEQVAAKRSELLDAIRRGLTLWAAACSSAARARIWWWSRAGLIKPAL
jgi:penicillin-binding protein 1A